MSEILILALLLCGLIITLAILYIRPSEISITDKAVDISEIMPIQMITDDVIVNGNGDLTVGYRIFLPEVFTLSKADATYIHDRLEGLLKMLPVGTVIHQQSFYYTGTYYNDEFTANVLKSENMKHFNGKAIINSYTNLYITFSNSEVRMGLRKGSSTTSLLRKLNYPFNRPYKKYKERLEEIEPSILNFENGLSSITQFSIRKMDSTMLNNAIYDFINVSYANPTEDATSEVVNPIMVTKEGDMKIGDQLIGMLSLTVEGENLHTLETPSTGNAKAYGSSIELPENIKSKCSMIYPLSLGLPFDHIVNTIIEITDSDTTQSVISTEHRGLNLLAIFYPPAKDKQDEQILFKKELTMFNHQTAYTAFNVILNDPVKNSLVRKIALAQQGFSFMNHSTCYVENAELANLFFCSIPGNARSNYRGFVNTTKQALCYLQKESVYLSDLTGHIYCDRFGNPSKINFWSYPGLNNRNRILIGPSGSGKSFWINDYAQQSHVLGHDLVIIDIGGSYKSMIMLNGGKYFDSSKPKTFAFNPFLCERDRNGQYIYIDNSGDAEDAEDLLKTISAILSYIWKKNAPISAAEGAILKKTIIAFYEYINTSGKIFPCLTAYRDFLQDVYSKNMTSFIQRTFEIEELLLMLEPYADGEFSYLLNATENIDIVNDRFIAFDMENAAKKEYFPLVTIITLQMVTEKIKKREGVSKELIIDEALDFLSDDKFGDFIGYLYRTFRKKEGSIMIAAQNVLFLKNCPKMIRDSILINNDTKTILDHSQYRSELPNLRDILSLSEEEIHMIDSLQRKDEGSVWREFFVKLGNDAYVFRNEVSLFASVAYDSRQSTVVRLRKLFEETGSTYTAINRYLEEKRLK